ncbi:hypothetical protein TRFO_02219 [Tritrichomonas foetus]|uniref:Uncharacterized protein n=1 Tax=Tritrichomonas foetus TaxID=1144522 RepID=A0A1J4JAH8_9EUKA|nr:hypothetical protein TRFO_02219 [Tritrichomonas foetus]|eukprot:OHS95239.1 hypothetical protein TRFO_02219 [Tritrichomonas foetus]
MDFTKFSKNSMHYIIIKKKKKKIKKIADTTMIEEEVDNKTNILCDGLKVIDDEEEDRNEGEDKNKEEPDICQDNDFENSDDNNPNNQEKGNSESINKKNDECQQKYGIDLSEIHPNLLKSPYMSEPFAFAQYKINKHPQMRKSCPQMISSRPKVIVPTKNYGMKKFRIEPYVTPVEYPERSKMFNKEEMKYKEYLNNKYKMMYSNTPYNVDIISIREKSIVSANEKMKEFQEEEIKQRQTINKESEIAVLESKKHDLFHGDEFYSPHDKSLRIIPVSDRIEYRSPRRFNVNQNQQ